MNITQQEAIQLIIDFLAPLHGFWEDMPIKDPLIEQFISLEYAELDESKRKYEINKKGVDKLYPYIEQIAKDFIIRLETVEYLGDTEVIAIETIANTGFYLDNTNSSTEFIREVMSLEDITGKVISEGSSKFPSEPPALTVSDGETTITAWRGTYSWMIEGEDGMGSGITVDSAHPLDYKDSIETINLSQNTKLTLNFESAPTSVSIKRYKLSATDYDAFEKIADSYNTIDAKAGNYLYEVIAKWEDPSKSYSGTVYYAFCTEK